MQQTLQMAYMPLNLSFVSRKYTYFSSLPVGSKPNDRLSCWLRMLVCFTFSVMCCNRSLLKIYAINSCFMSLPQPLPWNCGKRYRPDSPSISFNIGLSDCEPIILPPPFRIHHSTLYRHVLRESGHSSGVMPRKWYR